MNSTTPPQYGKNAPHPNLTQKKPPQNNEAEQAALASIMIDQNAASSVLFALNSADFYLNAHKVIFLAMQSLAIANRPVDIVTVLQELDKAGKTAEAGGLDYLTFITNTIATAANHRHYTDIVKANSLRRQLISACDEIAAEAYKGENEEILPYSEQKIFDLSKTIERTELAHIAKALASAFNQMEQMQTDETAYRGIPTGFDGLDGYLNGFQSGDLVVLAARPGHGKTSLGMNFAVNAAFSDYFGGVGGIKRPHHVAVFSLEMPKEQLAKRMLCSVSRVSMSRASKGKLEPAEWARMRQKMPVLDRAKIFIDDTSAITPAEIISKCRRLKRESKLDLVMIDYLQLMNAGKKTENRQQEISEITRALKIGAKDLEVPIILLSQLSREVEKRKDKQPMMSDLRESGAIEQDADIILFIQKPEPKEGETVNETIYKLVIAKHRNGELGTVKLKWHGEFVTFEDFNEDPAQREAAYALNNRGSAKDLGATDDNLSGDNTASPGTKGDLPF
ncbi:MAG: replicative DNA helicase [Firmicutes bacterium]|nr:replicative DNA helicase [Bacillota bacterium]